MAFQNAEKRPATDTWRAQERKPVFYVVVGLL
jgi:hypothetical protein